MVDFIQTAEVKAPVIADLKGLGFGDPPVHQRVLLIPAPSGLICRNPDVLQGAAFFFQPVDLFGQQMGFLAGRYTSAP